MRSGVHNPGGVGSQGCWCCGGEHSVVGVSGSGPDIQSRRSPVAVGGLEVAMRLSARSSIIKGDPPWSAGRERVEKGRTMIGACSCGTGGHKDNATPPQETVAIPEIFLDGGGRADPPGAINVDPPMK